MHPPRRPLLKIVSLPCSDDSSSALPSRTAMTLVKVEYRPHDCARDPTFGLPEHSLPCSGQVRVATLVVEPVPDSAGGCVPTDLVSLEPNEHSPHLSSTQTLRDSSIPGPFGELEPELTVPSPAASTALYKLLRRQALGPLSITALTFCSRETVGLINTQQPCLC
ncbi:hypothetical protein BD413DRAFT_228991 [Trametes elegans]|nr:hypothetical protein BD413DRAFT_228991 [Trametes elegans]